MAFFLIGRGADDALQLLSANAFDSRQDAMAELSRITSEATFSQWDLEVFVVDLDAGVPVLLVRPQRGEGTENAVVAVAEGAEPVADEGLETAVVADDVELEVAVVAEDEEPAAEAEPVAFADVAGEIRGDLREALKRTAEQMSSEGIVPPPSAGLESEASQNEAAEAGTEAAEPGAETPALGVEAPQPDSEAPEEGVPAETDAEAAVSEAADISAEEIAQTEAEGAEGQSWPWDAPATAPAAEPEVSPEIATVYEGLEQMEAQEATAQQTGVTEGTPLQAEGSDFILDLDAIQPVAMEPQGTDAAGPPARPVEIEAAAEAGETPLEVATEVPGETAEEDAAPADEPVQAPSEEQATTPSEPTDFPSSMTEYTCEDCVYVETCPNRDQREPKDCGSFQWK